MCSGPQYTLMEPKKSVSEETHSFVQKIPKNRENNEVSAVFKFPFAFILLIEKGETVSML